MKAFESSDVSEVLSELEEDNILDTAEETSDDEDIEQDEEEDSTDNADDIESDSSKSSITNRDLTQKPSLQEIIARGRPQGPPRPHRPHKPWRHPCCKQRHALRCKVRKLRVS